MANLYLDKAGAMSVVQRINREIEALKETANNINVAVVQEMPNYWQGVSHDKAESTYDTDYRDFLMNKVPEMVDSLNQFMQQCVDAITDVDNQLAGH